MAEDEVFNMLVNRPGFNRFLDDLVRRKVGLRGLEWKYVTQEARDNMWKRIQKYYDIDESTREKTMNILREKLRDFRMKLYNKFIAPNPHKENLELIVPKMYKTFVDRVSWDHFVEYKLSEISKTQALNKRARGMNRLPSELTTKILSSLPTSESVLDCKSVCKEWQAALAKHRLGLLCAASTMPQRMEVFLMPKQINHGQTGSIGPIDFHANVTTHKYLSPILVGSCNGLVCFGLPHNNIHDPVYIMNPLTGEHLHLPKLVYPFPCYFDVKAGFGYCESTGEYKVVRTYDQGKIQVYTLGDGRGWRNKEDFRYKLDELSGIFAHGRLFWLDRSAKLRIVSFDLHTEIFKTVSPPPIQILKKVNPIVGLAKIGLSLCLYYMSQHGDGITLCLWSPILEKRNCLRANARCRESNWVKLCTIELGKKEPDLLYYVPIALGKNNILLLWRISMMSRKSLCLYDLNTKTNLIIWKPRREDLLEPYLHIVPHMALNVSLKGFGAKHDPCCEDMHKKTHFQVHEISSIQMMQEYLHTH